MAENPYQLLPAYTRWSRSVAAPASEAVDPAVGFPFRITPADKIVTAGSCFAQHIARHLKENGFNYWVIEDGHPIGGDELRAAYNYGTFSARYGNVYTSRQLLQLYRMAFDQFTPVETFWQSESGHFIDPYRPNIQPNGFRSLAELRADRQQHLAAVRRLFEGLDIFVFTLGLTECWCSRADGAVFPVCPGVAGGSFSDDAYTFVNLRAGEVVAEMEEFVALLAGVNPRARIILTVSPVPLIATAEDRHVLVSTTYSKAALRVAAEELAAGHDHVAYFPSYEIITGPHARGRYYADDLRNITEAGVEHVMRIFLNAAAASAPGPAPTVTESSPDGFIEQMQSFVSTKCEEELIEAGFDRDRNRDR